MVVLKLKYWIYGLVLCAGVTGLSYEFLDRPLSFFAHDNLHAYPIFAQMTGLTEYFPPLAILIVAVLGAMRLGDYPLGYRLEALLLSAVSLIVARAAKDQLKFMFGRTWPETWTNNNPSLIKDGAYGFHPFHGGIGYESFPSGHTVGICAVTAALWLYYPRFWPAYLALILVIAIGLVGANYHFLSDILAGGFIGASSAIFCTALFGRQRPALAPKPMVSTELTKP